MSASVLLPIATTAAPRAVGVPGASGLTCLAVSSDLVITAACCAMLACLIRTGRRNRALIHSRRGTVGLLAFFLIACAITHLLAAAMPTRALSWPGEILRAVTAGAAFCTAIALWPLMEKVLAVPSPADRALTDKTMQRLTQERDGAEAARQQSEQRLRQNEKLTALGQLAGGIAHDFNNVLQAIQGGATLLQRHASNEETVKRLARMIEEATRRGGSVTRRLLAFARRDELHAESICPRTLLDGLAEFLGHTLGAPITVAVEVAEGTPEMMADRGQIETVLVNLATNARDAMPEGGRITFRAECVDKPADNPFGLVPGRYVRLSVIDTGTGMDEATLARAAEPFFTTKPQGKGTGLGLSMARGFAEQSGGTLRITSGPGKGTTVTLWLPSADSSPGALPPVLRTAPAGRTLAEAPRILFVDDEDLVREVIGTQLSSSGFAVTSASSAQDALTLLMAGEHFDLLLSDYMMPGMNGLALIRAVKSREPHLPAILLTGRVADPDSLPPEGIIRDGFCLLRKPVASDQLASRVTAMLHHAEIGPVAAVGAFDTAHRRDLPAAAD